MPVRLVAFWICFVSVCWAQVPTTSLPSYNIYNVAGNGTIGYADGSSPLFNHPQGIWYDPVSNAVFVADTANNRIRRVEVQIGPQGPQNVVATTVAGSGLAGVGGCKQPGDTTVSTTVDALTANIWEPEAVAVDNQGNVYIADSQNNCVRQLVGSNVVTYAGDGVDGYSGDGGNPLLASFSLPGPLAIFQKTDLLISDFNRVRVIQGNTIYTLAGGGQSTPSTTSPQSPVGVSIGQVASIASDPVSNAVFIANSSQVFVLKGESLQFLIGGEDPIPVTNVPGGVSIRSPQAMAVDNQSNLLIADTQYSVILRVTPDGIADVIAGISGDPGNSGDSTPFSYGPATQAKLSSPMGLAVDPSGNIYIADTINNRIRVLVPATGGSTTGPMSSTAQPGTLLGQVTDDSSPAAGDPVTIATGNVFHAAMDYHTAGQNMLGFNRYYNSRGDPNTLATELGVNWRSNYDRYIRISSPNSVIAERGDGRMLPFTSNGGAWSTEPDIDVQLTQSGSTWTLTNTDDSVETYTAVSSTKALLNTIQARNGYTRTLAYDGSNRLISVMDSYNRSLNFTYSGTLLQTVATPDGLTISYSYSLSGVVPGVQDQLTSVAYSTNPVTSRSYLYENSTVPFAMTGIIDEDGNRYASWTYDSLSRALTSQQGAGAEMATIVYNDTDGSRLVSNSLGQQEVYRFTMLENEPKTTEIDRAATASVTAATRMFTYDSNGYIASQTDWSGNLTNYVNDVHGQPLNITEAVGTPQQRTFAITYLAIYHLPVQIVAPGLTANFVYDGSGNLLTSTQTDTTTLTVPSPTNGQNRTWTYTWANSLLASMQSPRTDVTGLTQFAYDSSGALTSVTNALGQTAQVTGHLPGGLPLATVDANGVNTHLTYDPRLRLLDSTTNTEAGPLTTTCTYDPAGNVTNLVLPDGSAFTASYDSAHRLTGIADVLQQSINYTLDSLGDLTQASVSNATGAMQLRHSSNFDSMGRVVTDTGGAGQINSYSYDANGNTVTVTDPLNRVTRRTFDAVNRPVKMIDPANGTTSTAYDPLDRVLSVTDANGNTTTYTYDGFGDVIQQVSPDTGSTTYWYDADGNLVQKLDATGAIVNYSYDALDRVISAAYPADPAENVLVSYDQPGFGFSIGQVTTVTDMAGTLTRSYDELGNVLNETRTLGAATLVTNYTYDAASRVASITYPSGWQVANMRDAAGRITGVTVQDPGGDPALPVLSNVSYQAVGPVNAMTFGNGVTETRNFDLDYRLTNLADNGAATLQNLAYGYDGGNNVLSTRDGVNAGNSQSFQYDSLNRLTNAMGSYGTYGYTYDPVGNRLSRIAGSVISAYSYAPGSNQLTLLTANGAFQNFSYTAAGNITNFNPNPASTFNLTYNQAGRLASVSSALQPVAQYTYDAMGHRLAKSGATTTLYQYDSFGRLIEETDSQANPLVDYIYLGTVAAATLDPGTGQIYYLHDDWMGTPQVATDADQNVAWSASYQPFGGISSTPALIVQDLRLPGQENDSDTGWYHNGFRDYIPALGRYLEADPMGLAAGLNPYTYAGGNPISANDPSGLDSGCPPTGDCFMDIFESGGGGAPADSSNGGDWMFSVPAQLMGAITGGLGDIFDSGNQVMAQAPSSGQTWVDRMKSNPLPRGTLLRGSAAKRAVNPVAQPVATPVQTQAPVLIPQDIIRPPQQPPPGFFGTPSSEPFQPSVNSGSPLPSRVIDNRPAKRFVRRLADDGTLEGWARVQTVDLVPDQSTLPPPQAGQKVPEMHSNVGLRMPFQRIKIDGH